MLTHLINVSFLSRPHGICHGMCRVASYWYLATISR